MRIAALLVVAACATSRPAPSPLRTALDADLRADWPALLAARDAVAALPPSAARAYHLGYIDWRLSSLAFVVRGVGAQLPHLARAIDELQQAVTLDPSLAEAHALLASCAGLVLFLDRSRLEALRPVIGPAWDAALAAGAANPRVQLLRAMMEVFAPPEGGGDRARGFARWREAIALFEREPVAGDTLAPIWGRAEAWAWLGGAYLTVGPPEEAAPALRQALALRPDFWWAQAALAQATTPLR